MSTPATRHSFVHVLLLLMALIWGINFSVVKYGTVFVPPLAFNGVRVALAAVALLVIAIFAGKRWPSRRDTLALLLLGMLGNGVYQVLFIEGVARTRAGTAALVLASSPALIAIFGRAVGVERTTRRRWAGIAVQLGGMALVVFGSARAATSDSGSLAGTLLVLAGAVAWAVFTVALKPFTHRIHPLQLAALTMIGGALPLVLLALPDVAATSWRAVPNGVWGAIVYSGIGGLVIAYLFWYRGVRAIGPTRTAMYGNLQPIIALAVAWITLHEIPTIWQGLGATGIMSGLLLTRS